MLQTPKTHQTFTSSRLYRDANLGPADVRADVKRVKKKGATGQDTKMKTYRVYTVPRNMTVGRRTCHTSFTIFTSPVWFAYSALQLLIHNV